MNEKPLLYLFFASGALILVAFAMTLFLPESGILITRESIGGRGTVAAVVGSGGVVVVLNAIAAAALESRDKLASYVVASAALAVSLILALKVASLLDIW